MSAPIAHLAASYDESTGEIYVPPRRFAADGSLRECLALEIPAIGALVGWTSYAGEQYALLDLEQCVRVQALLDGDHHQYGARYVGHDVNGTVRFSRA